MEKKCFHICEFERDLQGIIRHPCALQLQCNVLPARGLKSSIKQQHTPVTTAVHVRIHVGA